MFLALVMGGCACSDVWYYCVGVVIEKDGRDIPASECIPRCGRMPRYTPPNPKDNT